ncbi:translation initiation factor IF-3 [Clostridium akagii]|uniref:translation initiation factor IF-3 n=1 Tax=Clostridium akagii TaxID=91623 RepID=UPI00047D1FD9|nr:translation initiation factor IF-3 [Clostridium akagii]
MWNINKNVNINEGIREREIRLLDGKDSTIINTKEALVLADEKNMDLVMVSPTATPPVCRIMDYNKFLYEQSKKQKEAKKNQKTLEIKEVRLSATIEDHDIEIKAKNAKKFLANGDKVKVAIRFRGRQNNYRNLGNKVFDQFLSKMEDLAVVEKSAQLEGRNMFMVLGPKK